MSQNKVMCLLIFFLLLLNKPCTQTPSYIHYDASSGLPSNLVYCGLQDFKDRLWFGTDKGLVCFDNNEFQIFTTKQGLPDPEVFNLWEDSNNNIWISCFRKRPCYRKNGVFITSNNDENLKNVDIHLGICNYFEENNNIWLLGSEHKIYSISKNGVSKFNLPDAMLYIKRIGHDIWGLATKSLIRFDINNPNKIYQFNRIATNLQSTESIENIEENILYSFRDKLVLYKIKNFKVNKIDSIVNLSGRLSVDRKNRFWVCSASSGAVCFNNTKQNLENPISFLADKKISHMIEDKQGTYWFFTLNDGIYSLPVNSPMIFNKENKLKSNNIISLGIDLDKNIITGDDEGNLTFIAGTKTKREQCKSVDGYNRILDILPLKNGQIWIASDEGVFIRHSDSNIKKLVIDGSPKALVFNRGNIWCGTSSGLFEISLSTYKMKCIFNQRITTIEKDSDGIVWVGGIEGLYNSKDSFQNNWGDDFNILRSRIISIQNEFNGHLWVVTPENGLLKLDTKDGRIQSINKINDFISPRIENIHSLYRENNGILWISTNKGLFSLNPQNLTIIHYDRHFGLANDDVRSVVIHNDTLWAGTASGVTKLLPYTMSSVSDFPVYFTNINYEINNKHYKLNIIDSLEKNTTIIPNNASLVKLNFTGLDYRNRGSLVFECTITEQLLPFKWFTLRNVLQWAYNNFKGQTNVSTTQENTYNLGVNIPPGRYEIKVSAMTLNHNRNIQNDRWAIIIQPKWHETLWFSLFIWCLIGLAIHRAYQNRSKLRELVIAVAQSRLIALQAQINPHFIGNCINAFQRFFYPPSPTLASIYTATFTRLLRKTLDYSEKAFITFSEEINYDLDYMQLSTLRLGKDKFFYEIQGHVNIPEDLPFPALFLQPILENATIHGLAPAGPSVIKINFSQSGGILICIITDNGPGINTTKNDPDRPKTHTSKGIEMLNKKAITLNQLFDLNLQFSIIDLSDTHKHLCGTKVIVSFNIGKVRNAALQQDLINARINKLTNQSIIKTRHEKN